jgi:hypothetical protein
MNLRDETTVMLDSCMHYKTKEPGSACPPTPYSGHDTARRKAPEVGNFDE